MVVDIGVVKNHIKTKADSTLRNMRKDDLIEYIRCLENNYNVAVSFNNQQAKNIELLIPKWIPVTEGLPTELPKDGSAWSERVRPSVDVLVKRKCSKDLCVAWYSHSHKEWLDTFESHSFGSSITHWMPLPEPPKEGE